MAHYNFLSKPNRMNGSDVRAQNLNQVKKNDRQLWPSYWKLIRYINFLDFSWQIGIKSFNLSR